MDPLDLIERCIAARRAYFASPLKGDSPELSAFVDAQMALDHYIEGEAARRAMAARAKRTAALPGLPYDLGTELLRAADNNS